MSRSIRSLVVTAVTLVVAACAGDREAPMAPGSVAGTAPVALPSQLTGGSPASQTEGEVRFSVGPQGGVHLFGAHALVFPANVICDPATSGYGPAYWGAPCATLTTPIEITARMSEVNGLPQVTFSPDLRFAPSSDPARGVWLYLRTSLPLAADRARIQWRPTGSASLVDEGALDASLRTWVATDLGVAYRRVGHFSGYVVTGD